MQSTARFWLVFLVSVVSSACQVTEGDPTDRSEGASSLVATMINQSSLD
ncbi:uncharacterized protein METZ01_LOCUS444270, partial [marine metagenome]